MVEEPVEVGVPPMCPGAVHWSLRTEDDAVVVRLAGELDLATAAELGQLLLRVAELATASTMVLEMSDVSFIDARGIGLIVQASTAAQLRGRVLQVDGLSGLPARVFRLVGLEDMLTRRDAETAVRG